MGSSNERTAAPATVGLAARFAIAVIAVAGCGHDWSAADAADGAGEETDAESFVDVDATPDGDGDALDAEADRPEATDGADGDDVEPADDATEDADAADDVPPILVCGDGRVDPPEECEPGMSEACTTGTCAGTRSCAGTCTWGTCGGFGAPPPNDVCSGPMVPTIIPETLGLQTLEGSTCAATDDAAATSCGPATGPDVLYRLDLTARRLVTFDTVGSDFDALLRLLAGPDCSGAELSCDDASAGGDPAQAELTAMLEPGTYWVAVDGVDPAARGNYVLNVTIQSPGTPPPNDACSGAIRLYLSETPRMRSGTTFGAGSHPASCALGGGPDVWYRITLSAPTLVYLDLLDGELWNAVLDVRESRGSCALTTSLACADDACGTLRPRWVGLLDAGEYFVLVDGRNAGTLGNFRLRYQGLDSACAVGATPIATDGTYTGTTTASTDDGIPSCSRGWGVPDLFYYLPLCSGRILTATTCTASTGFDTVLGLYERGCSSELACNDNGPDSCSLGSSTSTITFTATEPALYLLDVTGSTAGGPLLDRGSFGLVITGM